MVVLTAPKMSFDRQQWHFQSVPSYPMRCHLLVLAMPFQLQSSYFFYSEKSMTNESNMTHAFSDVIIIVPPGEQKLTSVFFIIWNCLPWYKLFLWQRDCQKIWTNNVMLEQWDVIALKQNTSYLYFATQGNSAADASMIFPANFLPSFGCESALCPSSRDTHSPVTTREADYCR